MEKRWPNNVHKWPQSNTFLANLRDPYNWGTLAYFDVSPFFVLSSMDKFVIAYMNTFNILMFGPPLIFLQIDVQSNLFSLVKVLHLHYYIGIKTPYPCLLMLKLMTRLDQAKRWRVKFQYISLIKAKLWTLCTLSSAYIHNHLHNQGHVQHILRQIVGHNSTSPLQEINVTVWAYLVVEIVVVAHQCQEQR